MNIYLFIHFLGCWQGWFLSKGDSLACFSPSFWWLSAAIWCPLVCRCIVTVSAKSQGSHRISTATKTWKRPGTSPLKLLKKVKSSGHLDFRFLLQNCERIHFSVVHSNLLGPQHAPHIAYWPFRFPFL